MRGRERERGRREGDEEWGEREEEETADALLVEADEDSLALVVLREVVVHQSDAPVDFVDVDAELVGDVLDSQVLREREI